MFFVMSHRFCSIWQPLWMALCSYDATHFASGCDHKNMGIDAKSSYVIKNESYNERESFFYSLSFSFRFFWKWISSIDKLWYFLSIYHIIALQHLLWIRDVGCDYLVSWREKLPNFLLIKLANFINNNSHTLFIIQRPAERTNRTIIMKVDK